MLEIIDAVLPLLMLLVLILLLLVPLLLLMLLLIPLLVVLMLLLLLPVACTALNLKFIVVSPAGSLFTVQTAIVHFNR